MYNIGVTPDPPREEASSGGHVPAYYNVYGMCAVSNAKMAELINMVWA